MGPNDSELPGIVGLAIVALIFTACWGAERFLHKSFPDSSKFFWRGNFLGAAAGSIILIAILINKNVIQSPLDDWLSTVPTGAVMGLIPGGLLGLAFGWFRSKLNRQ